MSTWIQDATAGVGRYSYVAVTRDCRLNKESRSSMALGVVSLVDVMGFAHDEVEFRDEAGESLSRHYCRTAAGRQYRVGCRVARAWMGEWSMSACGCCGEV